MERRSPFESVVVAEIARDDGSRSAVPAHAACVARHGLVTLSTPTQISDTDRYAREIDRERCGVCREHLWRELDDGEGVRGQGRDAARDGGQQEEEGDVGARHRQEGAAVQGAQGHGLGGATVPRYRVKATQVEAEQILGRDVNVSTRRGLITARDGEWVIHDALGVAEVLDGAKFSERYELVPEEEIVANDPARGEPDPQTPRDAPREDVPTPAHLQDYLTGRSDTPGETGAPGDPNLTDAEAREAAKDPDEKPVVGSAAPVLPSAEKPQDPPRQDLPTQDPPKQDPPKQDQPWIPAKNRGGRPPKHRDAHGH